MLLYVLLACPGGRLTLKSSVACFTNLHNAAAFSSVYLPLVAERCPET